MQINTELVNEVRISELMRRAGIEALIATTPANVTYFSGFRGLSHQYTGSVHIALYLPNDPSSSIIILPMGEARELLGNKMTWMRDIRPYGSFKLYDRGEKKEDDEIRLAEYVGRSGKDVWDVLIEALNELGLSRASVGLDEDYFTHTTYDLIKTRLNKELPNADVRDASALIKKARMVKTKEEIRRIRVATEIVEKAMQEVLRSLQDGISGSELCRVFKTKVAELGGIPIAPTIGIGKMSYMQNIYVPARKKLTAGDLIRFDVSCNYEHYFSDIARNAVYKKADEKQKQFYSAVLAGHQKALNMIRPNVRANELFRAIIDEVKSNGISDFHRSHCGHGIGLDLYDPPLIAEADDTPLEEGMVINIEVPYYELGFGGIHLEDTVVVQKDGIEFLSTSSRELLVIT